MRDYLAFIKKKKFKSLSSLYIYGYPFFKAVHQLDISAIKCAVEYLCFHFLKSYLPYNVLGNCGLKLFPLGNIYFVYGLCGAK